MIITNHHIIVLGHTNHHMTGEMVNLTGMDYLFIVLGCIMMIYFGYKLLTVLDDKFLPKFKNMGTGIWCLFGIMTVHCVTWILGMSLILYCGQI